MIFFGHVALSRGTLSRSHLPAAHPLLRYSIGSLQSLVSPLHQPSPSVSSCSGTLYDLSLFDSNTFSDSRLSLSRTIRSLRPCRLRLHTDLLKITVSVLLCSRDLEDFLSHLYPAHNPYAFPDETSLDSPVLHPQHSQICHDVVDQSPMTDFRVRVPHPLVTVSVHLHPANSSFTPAL